MFYVTILINNDLSLNFVHNLILFKKNVLSKISNTLVSVSVDLHAIKTTLRTKDKMQTKISVILIQSYILS